MGHFSVFARLAHAESCPSISALNGHFTHPLPRKVSYPWLNMYAYLVDILAASSDISIKIYKNVLMWLLLQSRVFPKRKLLLLAISFFCCAEHPKREEEVVARFNNLSRVWKQQKSQENGQFQRKVKRQIVCLEKRDFFEPAQYTLISQLGPLKECGIFYNTIFRFLGGQKKLLELGNFSWYFGCN